MNGALFRKWKHLNKDASSSHTLGARKQFLRRLEKTPSCQVFTLLESPLYYLWIQNKRTAKYNTHSINKCAAICQGTLVLSGVCSVGRWWRCIVERLGKAERAEKQRGEKLAVTEKMRIWRQGDKEFKQNEACRLAALPSVTGVISWGSLSLCLLPLFI